MRNHPPRCGPGRWFRPGFAAALVAFAVWSGTPGALAEQSVRPAKLMVVAAMENAVSISLPALIEASESAELGFQVAGVVATVLVREGQSIAEGVEIARLDQRDLEIELAMAEANYAAADTEFERAERLIVEGAISQAVHDQRKTQREVMEATLDAARKRLDDSVLRSPFAGLVAEVHVEAFQNIAPQQTVVTLQTTGTAEAVVQVPATLLAHSRRVTPRETAVVLDAAPDTPIPAHFHSLATRADPAAQTFEMRFTFTPPADLVVLPGMTGIVRSTLLVAEDGGVAPVAVPIEAILSEADRRYLWVVDPESMTVSRRAVTLGDGVGRMLPVLDGLAAGEIIVAAGVSYLHEGMKIRRYEP